MTSSTTTAPTPYPPQSAPLPVVLWAAARRLIHALTVGYALLFILYLAARFTIGERSHLVALANSLLPWLCWVGMALGALGLLYRDRWLLVGLQIPAVAAFALAYGALFWPVGARPAPGGPVLRAVMYNVCG